jgi:glutamyl-tRNA(Gln) amidotransferase subunit E
MVKMGLEIHQRLACNKLFCSCPSELAEPEAKPDLVIRRRLHPVLSEMGETDQTAKEEFGKGRTFVYHAFNRSNCLVEMDEEPPHALNPEALSIALELAQHLNMRTADELHVMRKMVIDGSNTSGFQRTAIAAFDGKLETSQGPIGIPLLAIEEESAGIIGTLDTERGTPESTYRLDRLGIPLVEITTTPDIKSPEHLMEVAEKLGTLMRATGKVARGLGTIRQDVNISTERGARVEIKGAQDLKMLPLLAQNEVRRQDGLVALMDELRTRFGGKIILNCTGVDVTEALASTKSPLISKGLASGSSVFGLVLEKHAGLIGRELQPGRRYGTELSDYAKTAGVKGIIHSDEDMAKYSITGEEAAALKQLLGMKQGDAFVLVVAPAEQAKAALARVLSRAKMDFVPAETRRANQDGTTSYMRPLPGKARLYPETDVPPVRITKELLASVSRSEGLEDKKARLLKLLGNKDMAERMLRSRNLALFEQLAREGADPTLVASTLENTLVSLRREGVAVAEPEKLLPGLFALYNKGAFVKAAIPEILREMAKGKPLADAAKEYSLLSGAGLEAVAKELGYDMKAIMSKYRTRVDPKELESVLGKKKSGKQAQADPKD